MMRQGLASVSTMVLNAQAAVYGDIAIACHERGIPYFQFRIQCGTGHRSGLPAGILLQLWGKEVFPRKESVLVHPVRQSGNHGSVRRGGVCVPQRAVAGISYGYGRL